MAKSIYDIINKKIDYKKEYSKIKKIFLDDCLIELGQNNWGTYSYVFNQWILKWKYRGVKQNIEEIMEEIEKETKCGKDPIIDCLYLCELILNVRTFLLYLRKNYLTNYGFFFNRFDDEMLVENIAYILNELGYLKHVEEDYKVLLVKRDADVISTALSIENVDISNLIMQYNDFKIVENIKEKQRILLNLATYLEPKRKVLKEKDSKLEQNLFMAFNKLNIRHNNLEGKYKEEYTSKLKVNELLEWYNRTYNLILIAIRLLELNEIVEPFEEIRKKYFDIKTDI
ncbi:MAG: hypothetical protein PHQ89_03055 [Bacilli bacterium]|nr:hypothetical protein [Bacilli bacterium]